MNCNETMIWHSISEKMPYAATTILLGTTDTGCWECGYWDGENWRESDTGMIIYWVTHWAEPNGPVLELPNDVARCDGHPLMAQCKSCARRMARPGNHPNIAVSTIWPCSYQIEI